METCGAQSANKSPTSTSTTTAAVRSNNAIHVCWHRGATVGLRDFIISSENQLSGYLLRKFKNSSGWQKLWVVFTSFCLFFYKNYQDEFALASLPLLGYEQLTNHHIKTIRVKNHLTFVFSSLCSIDIPLGRPATKTPFKRSLCLSCHSRTMCTFSAPIANTPTIDGWMYYEARHKRKISKILALHINNTQQRHKETSKSLA